MVGIRYKMGQDYITGIAPVPGSGERTISITAEAVPGYVIVGDATWHRLYGKPLTMTFIAEDDFSGPSDTLLVDKTTAAKGPNNMLIGREFSSVGARRPRWAVHLLAESLQLDGAGLAKSRPSIAGTSQLFDAGAETLTVELTVARLPRKHGTDFSVRLGADQDQPIPRGGLQIIVSGTSTNSASEAEGGIAIRPGNELRYTSDAGLLGVWRFRKRGKVISLELPNGDQQTWDMSGDSSIQWGTGVALTTGGNNRNGGVGAQSWFDNIRVTGEV